MVPRQTPRPDRVDAPAGHRRSRALAVALWCAVGIWASGAALLIQQRSAGGPTYGYWLETTVSAALITPIALLLAARRPDHRLSRLYAGFVIVSAVQLFSGATAAALTAARPSAAAIFALVHEAVQTGFVILLLCLVLLYPTGHLLSRRWRPVAWALFTGGAMVGAGVVLAPRLANFAALDNPLGVDGEWLGVVNIASGVLFGAGAIGAVASLLVRRRRASGIERLQLRWFTFCVLSGIVLLFGLDRFLPANSIYGSILWTLVPSAVLVSIGVAIFRYRLLEIDRIISRTVSYAIVSALLVALYAATIVALTPLLAGLGGGSNVAIAAATLMVAGAFRPVRGRVQSGIDRRFNRDRYDAARTVQVFAGALRDETDIEQLSDRLVQVVGTTVAPQSLVLWLASEQPGRT